MNALLHMTRLALAALLVSGLLVACATTPAAPPGTVVTDEQAAQVQPGSSRADLLARLGPTTSIRFTSGVEVWRYLLPPAAAQAGAYGEYVVVLDAQGRVIKTRRAAVVYQISAKN
ncbi:outer membrane protein assembly factor BamE domain-containing protein [Massilia sp. PWRC2]|uniref:outer membrane protein assembly factor BamE domain-containing protein n=1 Tax=Massilia sp. PWRC2 TaxID=2804626 RepID=UPI003CFB13B8